jgi:hypothetical protein
MFGSIDWEGLLAHVPPSLYVKIHSEKTIEVHLSPQGSHFADVNVLGMDFIVKNRVYPRLDFDEETFHSSIKPLQLPRWNTRIR